LRPSSPAQIRSTGFGQKNSLRESTGLLVGWRLRPAPRWSLAASANWTHGIPRDSAHPGSEESLDGRLYIEANVGKQTRFRLQYRQTSSKELVSGGLIPPFSVAPRRGVLLKRSTESLTARMSGEILHPVHPRVTIRIRAEAVEMRSETNRHKSGFHLYNEMDFRLTDSIRLQSRIAIFDSNTPTVRMYVYEPDVTGKLTTPSFSGTGTHHMLLVRTSDLLMSGLRIELKWARQKNYLPSLKRKTQWTLQVIQSL
jgi:hypothetical protein